MLFRIGVWNKLFRASLLLENNIAFPPGVRYGQDRDFSLIASALSKRSFYLGAHLYHYNSSRETSSTNTRTGAMFMESAQSLKKTCDYLEKIIEAKNTSATERENISLVLFSEKLKAKNRVLAYLPRPDFRLFRAMFPELNGQLWRHFLETRRPYMLVLALAAWRMDLAAFILLRLKQWRKGRRLGPGRGA